MSGQTINEYVYGIEGGRTLDGHSKVETQGFHGLGTVPESFTNNSRVTVDPSKLVTTSLARHKNFGHYINKCSHRKRSTPVEKGGKVFSTRSDLYI